MAYAISTNTKLVVSKDIIVREYLWVFIVVEQSNSDTSDVVRTFCSDIYFPRAIGRGEWSGIGQRSM